MTFQKGNKFGRKFTKGSKEYLKSSSRIKKGQLLPSPVHQKGRTLSDEHKRKLSIAAKKREQSGAMSHFWKGGITSIHLLIRNSAEYKIWRKGVFERDKYRCIWCADDKGHNLQADHIKPFCDYPELRFAIDNGRTLCVECHRKTDTWGHRSNKFKK